jgi:hypothetical protein
MATDTFPDVDLMAVINGLPTVIAEDEQATIPMRVTQNGPYRNQLFDVTMTKGELEPFLPIAANDAFVCAIRNGVAKFKVRGGADASRR